MSHGRCVAHILCGLDALTEFHGEAWAAEMRKLLQRAVHEVNEAARAGEPLSAEAADQIEREYDGIIAAAVAWHGELPPPDGGEAARETEKAQAQAGGGSPSSRPGPEIFRGAPAGSRLQSLVESLRRGPANKAAAGAVIERVPHPTVLGRNCRPEVRRLRDLFPYQTVRMPTHPRCRERYRRAK